MLPDLHGGSSAAGQLRLIEWRKLVEAQLRQDIVRKLVAIVVVLALALLTCAITPAEQAHAAARATTTSVKVGKSTFKMKLASGKAAKAFRAYLSKKRTFKMNELNGNEKYYYFPVKTFPAKEKRYAKVQAGDVMLYGDNCLVIFYKTHETSYKYTKIGHLTSTKGLAKALGKNGVKVTFGKINARIGWPRFNARKPVYTQGKPAEIPRKFPDSSGHSDCQSMRREPFGPIASEPTMRFLRGNCARGRSTHDRFATTTLKHEGFPDS